MTSLNDSSHNKKNIRDVTVMTAVNLQNTASRLPLTELTQLELPEINRITQEVARVVPAGNVPAIILNGLALLEQRKLTQEDNTKYINLLFKGVRMSLDRAIYSTFFAGPAAVIYGYQQLLKLTGKDVNAAFPDGTWQFYLEFALREDSARHTNETTGFQANVPSKLNESDRLAAWLIATSRFIEALPHILENEWRERVILRQLAHVTATQRALERDDYTRFFGQLHHQFVSRWERQRPYHRADDQDYPTYRRNVFEAYWQPYYKILSKPVRAEFDELIAQAEREDLPKFQQQMSLISYLEPGEYNEIRTPYPQAQAHVAVIRQGRYYLVPLSLASEMHGARIIADAILSHETLAPHATLDQALVTVKRGAQAHVRPRLSEELQREIALLQRCPFILNWDLQDSRQRLSSIRQGQRGIGDHPMTIFRTTDSMVFDQSHIYFDGAWGANVAQVLTNEALVWANHLVKQPPLDLRRRPQALPVRQLNLHAPKGLGAQLAREQVALGTSAENRGVKMKSILSLRELLKKRSDLAQITVNDLFILYRGIHAQTYKPSGELMAHIEQLAKDPREASQKAYQAVMHALKHIQETNPSILIPVDASRFNPRERVFPTTFRNPLTEFMEYHQRTLAALDAYQNAKGHSATHQAMKTFEGAQTLYLRLVGGFGELLTRYKEIAMTGNSTSTNSIKFLAHMPAPLRKILNSIPDSFDVLNEVIKGEEVFSNTGRVALGATLRRFITAKDDNQQKTLCWGVQTDDHDVARLSLRDFRPHVSLLQNAGRADLAQRITQEYLDSYADGLNRYTEELRRITITSVHPTTRGLRLPWRRGE